MPTLTTWLLIVMCGYSGIRLHTERFPDEQSCIRAGQAIEAELLKQNKYSPPTWVCRQ